ncbi:hypothetical protein GKZ90_0022025 [Flavobacterium sp. MC2016-06]|jgi:hypothetical protein|uniref:hypothetical protein n=1 Tax=Flavobacterium sp. MC2016-06 TaxID=2676308 RepID=UPI0012BB039D|nr:hypothetical protein [Flavobacterium sp. MC2016-06]MBU3861115.1 hypothetical protein [Flavobacterium sp. MC2016-06]
MIEIPKDFTEFLYWVKERTELFWSIDPQTSENDFVCEDWIYGAKWIGLTEKEIDAIEIKYAIKFTEEHRSFLKILHTIDRKERREYTETFEEDAPKLIKEFPFFYNWMEDETEIKKIFSWPFDTMLEDVAGNNQVWLKSWGNKPNSEIEIKKIYSEWFQKTPAILPLTGYRFVISDPNLRHRPVLSIYGSDIIVFGWNFRSYLLNELQEHLNISKLVYDEEYDCYDPILFNEVQEIFDEDYKHDESKIIPYWQEMILIWNSGWDSFGLKYPGEEDSEAYLIIKTYTPDSKDNSPLTFNAF